VSDRPDISSIMPNDALLRNNCFICKERLIVINANSLTSISEPIRKTSTPTKLIYGILNRGVSSNPFISYNTCRTCRVKWFIALCGTLFIGDYISI